jgi:two-component system response regulator HydG
MRLDTPEIAVRGLSDDILITTDETQPARLFDHTASRGRSWMWVGAAAVMSYAIAILVVGSMSADLGFFSYQGSAVLNVDSSSAAGAAGLQSGDTILEINGTSTLTAYATGKALRGIDPGDAVTMVVARGDEVHTLSYVVGRSVPLGSAAGILLGTLLLVISLLAGTGGPGSLPRAFFRSTLIYVVFLAGAFSLDTALRGSLLTVPWLFSMALAAPTTCHHMLRFPAGRAKLTRRQWMWMYIPPLVLGTVLSINATLYMYDMAIAMHQPVTVWGGMIAGAMAAAYLTIGAVARARRLRRKRAEVDPVAIRWLQLGGVMMATPLILACIWALRDTGSFVAGGFRPFVAVAMVGGSACVVLAMTRTPFGELDRIWRKSSGYVLATALAATLYLTVIGVLGGAASVLSGGSFTAALAATLAAAVVFGPVRKKLQKTVDERFGRDRSRARRLLRDAAEAAVATLDIEALQNGVVHRVRAALQLEGAGIYVADDEAEGGWRRVSSAGTVAISRKLPKGAPLSKRLDSSLTARAPRTLCANILAIPLVVRDREPAALVVTPREGHNLDDEERELLSTAAANLVVAIGNARAHGELRELTEKLRKEVEIAESRRREIARLKDRVEEENRDLVHQLASRTGTAPVIGKGLEKTFELVHKVSHSEANVLVCGETGVGKELVARAIHAGSARRDGPFIVVDCGAISAGIFESTLFGHEKGAFTGAIRATQGAFRAANGGTVFLDELGELPLELQPKLLRAIQEREVQPLGADTPVSIDVRVVAGTNRDLGAEVAAGNFREDLLYRLQVVEIEVPPLRKRRGDIIELAEHFLVLHAQSNGRSVKALDADAKKAMLEHEWPGNVRELEHALEAAVVYASGDEIRARDLPIYDEVFRSKGRRAINNNSARITADGAPATGLRETLEELEAQRLKESLAEHNGNKTRTAKALGMSRGALLRRLKRYAI